MKKIESVPRSALSYLILAVACIIGSLPLRPARPETTGTVWSTVDGDAQRSRGISTTLAPPLTLKWKSSNYLPVGDENDGIFLIAADSERVYGEVVDRGQAYLEAFGASTGRIIWRVSFGHGGDAAHGGGFLADGRIFLLLMYNPTLQQQVDSRMQDRTQHLIVALDAQTGQLVWENGTATLATMRQSGYYAIFVPVLRAGDKLITLTDSFDPLWMGMSAYRLSDGQKMWGPVGPPGGLSLGELPLLVRQDIVEGEGNSYRIELQMRRPQDGTLKNKFILDAPQSNNYATGGWLENISENTLTWSDDTVPLISADRDGILYFYNPRINQDFPIISGSSLGRKGIVYALCRNLRRPTGTYDNVGRPIYKSWAEKSPRLVAFDARSFQDLWSISGALNPVAITGNVLWCCTDILPNPKDDVMFEQSGGKIPMPYIGPSDLIAIGRDHGKILWRHRIGAYSQIIAGPKGLYLYVWNQKTTLATSAGHLECWAPAGR